MGLKTSEIYVGTPEQNSTTGAIAFGDLSLQLPELPSDTLPAGYKDIGYINEDGVKISPSISTTKIKDWSGAKVRTLLEEFDGTIEFSIMQLDENAFIAAVGEENVSITAASATHGKVVKAKFGVHMPPESRFVFRVKDGDKRLMVTVPNGQITEFNDFELKSTSTANLSVKLSCNDDGNGDCMFITTDDGQKVTVASKNDKGEK